MYRRSLAECLPSGFTKMVARNVVMAYGSPSQCIYLLVWCSFFVYLCNISSVNIRYTRQELLEIINIPADITRPPGSRWFVVGPRRRQRRRRERKQKRGCRSGAMLKLRRQPHKPPLPSLYLSNVRSLVHKTEDLEFQLADNCYIRDC